MEEKQLICNRCQIEIKDVGYIKIIPTIMLQDIFDKSPLLFSCKEHAENYNHSLIFHDNCWCDTLRDNGVILHDLKEVAKKYTEEELKKKNEEAIKKS